MILIKYCFFQHRVKMSLYQFMIFIINYVSNTIRECLHIINIIEFVNFFNLYSLFFDCAIKIIIKKAYN